MKAPLHHVIEELDRAAVGAEMHRLAVELFPLCRSITGDGVRKTLARAREIVPLEVREVPSGTPVLDWTVPPEWNVLDAWIKDSAGRKVVDFAASNLHLMGYSVPVRARMPLGELRPHLYSLPDQPDLIPYRTSYYREDWGFCLAHRVLASLPEGEYEVFIDSTLEPGSLSYGELLLPGASEREFLVSCHVCHPSLANDNLSGLAVTLFLARELARLTRSERRYSYRFLWLPGTIGAIAWLDAHAEGAARRIAHGLVAANLGDPGPFHYKRSRRGDAEIDRAAAQVLAGSGEPHAIEDFVPYGYDERQYGSPGFDLPVGSLTRTPWGRYPEYHTSADDLDLITPAALAGSLLRYLAVVDLIEANRTYLNLKPHGEPQLGRRGLYDAVGGAGAGDREGRDRRLALLWVLNLADGRHDLLAIAERSGLPFAAVRVAADALVAAELLREVESEP
jgi:aminopeptidase-like protein